LARSAHGKISRNFGEIPQDLNKIGPVFANFGKIAPDFLLFQSISRNFRSAACPVHVTPRRFDIARSSLAGRMKAHIYGEPKAIPLSAAYRIGRQAARGGTGARFPDDVQMSKSN
jgi:hypothetical protein